MFNAKSWVIDSYCHPLGMTYGMSLISCLGQCTASPILPTHPGKCFAERAELFSRYEILRNGVNDVRVHRGRLKLNEYIDLGSSGFVERKAA
jgi:hypothetical protein